MGKVSTGQEVGQKIADAIGLPLENILGFELRCYVDEIVTVRVELYPEVNGDLLADTLRGYKLERME